MRMKCTGNPGISPLGELIYFLDFCMEHIRRGLLRVRALKFFLVVGDIPVANFLLINYLLDAPHTSNSIFLKGRQMFVNVRLLSFPTSIKHQRTLK